MPERWEQELRRLNDVDAPVGKIRSRADEPARGDAGSGLPPTRQRVVAGIVAFGVFMAAASFGWLALRPRGEMEPVVGGGMPTLVVAMRAAGVIADGSDDPVTKVDFSIDYGEIHAEGFTSTMPSDLASVDWVAVEDLGVLFPAPVVGSAVAITSDGSDARVTIGRPEDWPHVDRFQEIDTLPTEPGRYVLRFEADYPDGTAATARVVDLVPPGTVQVALEPGDEARASATLATDGRAHAAFLSTTWRMASDEWVQSPPLEPSFTDDEFIEIDADAPWVIDPRPVVVVTSFLAPKSWTRFVNDSGVTPLGADRARDDAVAVGSPGRQLLGVRSTWQEGKLGWAENGTLERAVFFFPIEIVPAPTTQVDETIDPTVPPDDSAGIVPEPTSSSGVLQIRCDEGRTTVLTPVVATTPTGVRVVVLPEGSPIKVEFRGVESDGWFGGDIEADGSSHPWPIAPGRTEVDCGPDAWEFEDSATFEVVDPEEYWAVPGLECGETERTEVVGYDGGAAEWVDERYAISGILVGVERDEVRMPFYPNGGGSKDMRWVIVREGRTVGTVWFEPITDRWDPRGSGLGRVTGEVCTGSGIEGTVPPRDPDQDGVDLDCTASNQIAFQHQGAYLLPSGESAMRANVSGIRSSDELLPPTNGTGDGGYEGVWTVLRDGKTVASIVYPSMDGVTCRWNAIGIDPSEL